jgi:flagellar protein FlgJ
MSISNQTDFYLNFQQFNKLKIEARGQSEAAASAVAQQFEGLFVQQMLAAMRSASNVNSVEDSSYMDFYQEMYDKQLAQTIAGQERLGISKLILQHMPDNRAGGVDKTVPLDPEVSLKFEKPSTRPDVIKVNSEVAASAAPLVADVEIAASEAPSAATLPAGVVVSRIVDDDFAEVAGIERVNSRWQNPHNFIVDILPQARSAAKSLGVSAELLLAQAALETGWGKHTMKLDDGRSSNNLFGIKAGPGWQGNSLHKTSLEYQDGVLQHRQSSFRTYATPAQSLTDYVDFLRTNPRYQRALQQAGDDQAFIREVHQAGYATDPAYADKVISILNGETLQRALANLKPGVIDHA